MRKKRNTVRREADAEFEILLDAISQIDFVALAERVRQKTKARLVPFALEHAAAQGRSVELADVERRVEKLMADSDRRDLALAKVIDKQGVRQAEEILKRLEGCRVFFFALSNGWKLARQVYGRWRVDSSIWTIRRRCPDDVAQYKAALRDWREARRRYLAAENEQTWRWYVRGHGNKNSVAYRSKIDLNRLGGEQWFRKRRLFKYMITELLPRRDERRRAHQELKTALARITESRNRILQGMEIPLELA